MKEVHFFLSADELNLEIYCYEVKKEDKIMIIQQINILEKFSRGVEDAYFCLKVKWPILHTYKKLFF